jgi:Cd2+/Zn2+-exporting ATPase
MNKPVEMTMGSATSGSSGADMVHMVLPVEGMYNAASEQTIEAVLNSMEGVTARASFAARAVRLDFDRRHCPMITILRRLDDVGFKPVFEKAQRAPDTQEADRLLERAEEAKPEAKRREWSWTDWMLEHPDVPLTLIGGLFLIAAALIHFRGGPETLRVTFIIISYVTAGWLTAIDTIKTLGKFKFDIDVLMFAAAFGAASLGHYEEGALLLFLFGLGGAGENLAMDRARKAIEALTDLAPETATVRGADGRQSQVPVEQLKVDDTVVVHPFDRVPADGRVITGTSAIDQSPITGESTPVEKSVGSDVFAGTINGDGLLLVRVTKLATESTLAKIVRLVEEAQTQRSPTETFTAKVERFYVPLVLLGTAALIVVPPLLGIEPRREGTIWAGWFYQAMAFLTGASPCALAIGTPAAVLCGIARAARIGVLIKGGVHLENLGRVTAIAFDKTGTLTRGRPEVTDVVALNGASETEILRLAASLEMGANHPLGAAIVAEARARELKLENPRDVELLSGRGVASYIGDKHVLVGRPSLLGDLTGSAAKARVDELRRAGKTGAAVLVDGRGVGLIGLADQPRENAAAALERLKRAGIKRTIMLTGDNAHAAEAVARTLHVDEFHGELMPEDKVRLIQDVKQKYGRVAMIGDGVNDAPALAAATVGIAMGGAGTDVAIETADVALMADDLAKLPDAVGLSRFSRRIVVQNLVIALGVIAVLAPTAALGGTTLGIAVLFHEGSTVVVVLNALRLLVWKAKD